MIENIIDNIFFTGFFTKLRLLVPYTYHMTDLAILAAHKKGAASADTLSV